ncbi:MAG: Crp/Fnr family transcriptional regulator [Prevotella sp.]
MENRAQQRFGEVLAQFTLFKGMSIGDLTQVMDHTKFDFRKYAAGKRIVKAGEVCHELLMITHGTLKLVSTHSNAHFEVEETIEAPYIIQPENLFGLPRRYRSTVSAETPVNLISLNKREVNILLETIEVFRINLLNTVSAQSQWLLNEPWTAYPQSLRDMLQTFFIRHCVQPQGEKTFRILMKQLAEMHGCKKLTVSKVLNEMKNEGLVLLSRGKIVIPEITALAETSNQ